MGNTLLNIKVLLENKLLWQLPLTLNILVHHWNEIISSSARKKKYYILFIFIYINLTLNFVKSHFLNN